MTIPNVDNTTLTNLSPNMDIGDVADPALRLAAFQYIYTLAQTIISELNSIPTANFQNLSITTGKLADLSVTTSKIALASVGVAQLSPGAEVNESVNNALIVDHKDSYENHGNLKNKLINGSFSVNERVVSGTVTLAAGAYGHDRWKAGAAGCTYTFATVDNVTTITISAGSLQQVIEGTSLESGTHTLSWGGTAQGKIGAGSYGATGITGAAVGGTNLTIEFNTGTLSKVQLEEGSYKTPFEQRSPGIASLLCLRYNRRIKVPASTTMYVGIGIAISTTVARINIPVSVRMRTTPPTLTNTGAFLLFGGAVFQTVTGMTVHGSTTADNILLDVTVASGLTNGASYQMIVNGDATAYINLDAEI